MGMSYRKNAVAIKIFTASIIVGMFAFFAIIVPDHLAEAESHDHCISCLFIKHAPLLEPEAISIDVPLLLLKERLYVSCDTVSSDTQLRIPLSRAPPSL